MSLSEELRESYNDSVSDENILLSITADKKLSMVGEKILVVASINNVGNNDLNASLLLKGESGYIIRSITAAGSGGNTWETGVIPLVRGSSKDVTVQIQSVSEVRSGVEAIVSYNNKNLTLSMPLAFHAGFCGDNICFTNENKNTCCIDCGCSSVFESCNLDTGTCESYLSSVLIFIAIFAVIGVLIFILINPNIDPFTKSRIINYMFFFIIQLVRLASSKKDKKGKGDETLVSVLPSVCPYCGSINFGSSGTTLRCMNCGRTFRKTG